MLVNKIRNHPILAQYLCNACEENNIALNINPAINQDKIVIICVDKYYNDNIPSPPPSPDCLIILECDDDTYQFYIVELKNINGPAGFDIKNIEKKFVTCLSDFMQVKFGDVFYSDDIDPSFIKLYFITDPYDYKKYPDKQNYTKSTKLDFLMATRIPKFYNKFLYIEPKIPNPTVNPC